MMEDKEKLEFKSYENIIHFIKFGLFSLSAGGIQFLSYALLRETFGLVEWASYFIALVLSVLWNFTLNRKFTFKSAKNVPLAMFMVACYYGVFTPLSTWWVKALNDIGWNEYVVLIGTMLTNFITEFIFQKYFVYHNHINTAVKPNKKA